MGILTDQLMDNLIWLGSQPILWVILAMSVYLLVPSRDTKNLPPHVPHSIPFLGNAIAYGMDPVKFFQDCRQKSLRMRVGPDGNHFGFNVPLANASAEAAYQKLTTPVFGKGVVYDVPNATFMQQKKFIKDALTTSAFKSYVPIILRETRQFFKEWKQSRLLVSDEMAELTIRTASACLMGKEIRAELHEGVAKLYEDLDGGLAPINVFFSWLPLPSYFARDRAQKIMANKFKTIINRRRETNDMSNQDLLQGLMSASYRDGEPLDDDSAAHVMIGVLMGGQHTSSSSSTWILFELARRPDLVEALLQEQSMVLTGKPDTSAKDLPDFDFESLKKMPLLECVIKESLRIHPPIHTMMRKVSQDLECQGYTIPKGHFLCIAPSVTQMDPTRFPNPTKFEPSRFIDNDEGSGEWTINGVDISQKSARSYFLPFGAGRHRCIGEAFGFLQLKTIIATCIREFQHELDGKFPESDYTSLITRAKKPGFIKITPRV